MQKQIIGRYFFFGILLATLVFTFFIFKPFLIILTLGVSFAVVLHPLFKWFTTKKLPSWLASLLIIIMFLILLCGPLLIMGISIFNQSQNVYHNIVNNGNIGSFVTDTENKINAFLPEGFSFDAQEKISAFITYISKNIMTIFSTTITTFFSFILLLVTIFYFLKDGDKWSKFLLSISPLSQTDNQKILNRLSNSINGIVKGYLLIALFQGILMGAGLAIFGVPNPALWGVVAAIASLIPSIGTSLVSIPAIIFLYTTGNTIEAIGLLAWATFMVGGIDNVLSPIIVGKKINVPKILVLFSVLGGISMLGPVGILIGPLVVSLLHALVSIYRNEFEKINLE